MIFIFHINSYFKSSGSVGSAVLFSFLDCFRNKYWKFSENSGYCTFNRHACLKSQSSSEKIYGFALFSLRNIFFLRTSLEKIQLTTWCNNYCLYSYNSIYYWLPVVQAIIFAFCHVWSISFFLWFEKIVLRIKQSIEYNLKCCKFSEKILYFVCIESWIFWFLWIFFGEQVI